MFALHQCNLKELQCDRRRHGAVNSVLAIGGVGGLAVGLAGREILENLFTGLIILSSSPFEVGDEVMFAPPTGPVGTQANTSTFSSSSCAKAQSGFSCSQTVEGIVVDVGWYRTTIRSFEREIYNIPNSVFSRNVVLNVTRKQREWRFFEFIGRLRAAMHGAVSQASCLHELPAWHSVRAACRDLRRRHAQAQHGHC